MPVRPRCQNRRDRHSAFCPSCAYHSAVASTQASCRPAQIQDLKEAGMSRRMRPIRGFALPIVVAAVSLFAVSSAVQAQNATTAAKPSAQPNDEEYTKKIKEYLQDPRITTELVDHLPASSTVPTPLKFLGRIVGTPGELTYAKDIYRYFDALDAASDRIKVWRIGKTEEGRDMVILAVADET